MNDATIARGTTVETNNGTRYVVMGSCTLGDFGLHYRVIPEGGKGSDWSLMPADRVKPVA